MAEGPEILRAADILAAGVLGQPLRPNSKRTSSRSAVGASCRRRRARRCLPASTTASRFKATTSGSERTDWIRSWIRRQWRARLLDHRSARRQFDALLRGQGFLAGWGNYLSLEILWQAQLLPTRLAVDLDEAERAALTHALLDLPRRSYRTRSRCGAGHLPDTPFRFRTYQRDGQPCPRCGAVLLRATVTSRPFHFWRGCQH